jgi:predicted nucleotidyltransferase
MRINEFTKTPSVDFDLGNAVEFHEQLNPKLFDGEQMRPEIRKGLLKIAEHFEEFIGVELNVVDITVSGSNAAYSYTDYSDIDLHIVVQVPNDPEYKELLDAKKNDYNARHDIKVKGIDVELYAQDADAEHHSLGIYSVQDDQWTATPERVEVDVDHDDVREKYINYRDRIKFALSQEEIDLANDMWADIKRMRKAGLETSASELSTENLVYKMLRNKRWIEQLQDHINDLTDRDLSIEGRKNEVE